MKLIQNRLQVLLESQEERLKFYRQMLDRRLKEAERGGEHLLVPQSRGVRLRLPGKPFHATPEIFFQEAGTTRFLLPEETMVMAPGKAALIPAGMPHGETWKGAAFLNVIVMFLDEGYSFHLGYLKERIKCSPLDRVYSPSRMTIVRYAEEMAAAGSSHAGRQVRRGLYLACLARLRDDLNSSTRTHEHKHPLLQRCLGLIDVHFSRMDFSVMWLAREAGCSPDHLSRLFRQETGCRLVQFIHQKRIDYASRLLCESDMNIAETAWACGFRQPSYFNRVFRAHTGLKPGQVRKAISGKTEFVDRARSLQQV